MKLVPFVIDRFAKFCYGGAPVAAMREVVKTVENSELSGSEKFDKAKEMFIQIGYGILGFALNLLIELVVAHMNSSK
jgi:hypothetical protein